MNFFVKYLLPGLAITVLVLATCNKSSDKSDEKTGLAGDQLDLFAVLNVVKESSSPEALEKSLNTKSTGVNNLDLNEDGQTDYIKVTGKKIDDASHILVLQVDVASGKTQDVAVIEIQKISEGKANIQIIGDKDLYGSDYIVEPKSDEAAAALVVATGVALNVWSWPLVAFVYSPAYVVWVSPYYYEYYPVWWEPWPVVVYDVYYPTVSVYHTYYAVSDGYRFVNIHEKYHSNYRVTTKFNYHEKSYGNVTKDNGKSDGNDKQGGNANKNYNGGDNGKSGGHGKSDKNVTPVSNTKSTHGSGNKSGGQSNQRSGGDEKGNVNPKQDKNYNTPKPQGKSQPKNVQPKPGGQPKGGGHTGGKGGHK